MAPEAHDEMVAHPFEIADVTTPAESRLRQPTNPWLLDEVADLIAKKIDDCGEPDGEIELWEPDRYGSLAARALLREGLIALRPGPLPQPNDIHVEQSIAWLEGLARRVGCTAPGALWPRDVSEAQRVVNIINALRAASTPSAAEAELVALTAISLFESTLRESAGDVRSYSREAEAGLLGVADSLRERRDTMVDDILAAARLTLSKHQGER